MLGAGCVQAERIDGREATLSELCDSLAKLGKWDKLLTAVQIKGGQQRCPSFLVVVVVGMKQNQRPSALRALPGPLPSTLPARSSDRSDSWQG